MRNYFRTAGLGCIAACLAISAAHAVILLNDGNAGTNISAPNGPLAGSGWQFQGDFGVFTGTPIAPQFFITAKHVSGASTTLEFNQTSYPLAQRFDDPFTDLTIWRITGAFPFYAPLYLGSEETGQPLVVFGRGTQRGPGVIQNSELRGWYWGSDDYVRRWGENVVTAIVNDGPANQYVYATLDQSGLPNEAHLSSGDSGGAVFIREAGTWKLAGINFAVDGPFFPGPSGASGFNAALFDARGFYYQNGSQYEQITGPSAVPTGFYATRISSKLSWIYSVIDPTGDANSNGRSNTLDYALDLNAPAPSGPGAIATAAPTDGLLTIVYRRITRAGAPQYEVQKAQTLGSWETAAPQETVQALNAEVELVTARVATSDGTRFLRLRITL